ncbi:MAG TPA: 50S ribosomal protein L25 [Spirochaetota bacterium]|nr:50S ribosomal protein L25 [Spirochaetota bacterium]
MSELILEAKTRENTGKEVCGRYRKEGYIPSIMYGQGTNLNILVSGHAFKKMYPKLTRSTIINLKLEKNSYDVLIKDYDKDSIRDEFVHIDFFQLDSKKPVHLTISLEFVGTPVGVREGGILEKHLDKVQVACLPKDIVPSIKVNVENLKINASLHVRDLEIDKKYKIISHADEVVVKIASAQKEEVETTTAATTTTTTAASAQEKSDKK